MNFPLVFLVVIATATGILATEGTERKDKMLDAEMNFINDKSLKEWKAPELLQKEFLYYLSGHDDEGRPIWIAEFGKWDIKKVFDGGEEMLKTFDTYVDQLVLNVLESLRLADLKATEEDSAGEVVVIVDMEGYNLAQLTSVQSMKYMVKRLSELEPIANKRLGAAYVINANFVAERFVNVIRPVIGGLMQRVEIFGTQKSVWMPKLLRNIPKDQLPEWYGGKEGFKPTKIFG